MVNALQEKGLAVFFDYEAMLVHACGDSRAGLNSAMARNIEDASAVVVCFSETYDKSKSCMRELVHADKQNKHMYCEYSTGLNKRPTYLYSPLQHLYPYLCRCELHGA